MIDENTGPSRSIAAGTAPPPDPRIEMPELEEKIASLDLDALTAAFVMQNELLVIADFLPPPVLRRLLAELPKLGPRVNRNFIPRHKKGGSVSRFDLDRFAPAYGEIYQNPALQAFFNALCGRQLQPCPASDPHTYALYYYTEPGDHIGYHYDTSYYQGARFTALLGLVNDADSVLEYQLYKDDPDCDTQIRRLPLTPGMLVFFNGDRLYHRITPLGLNQQRIVLTMEYLTSVKMGAFRRFVSNMKDAIAYFGFRQVFGRR